MTAFINETIGSFDKGNHGVDATHEWVSIWFDEKIVEGFSFHDVGMRDVMGRYHRVHGMIVEARYVFAAIHAFSNHPNFAMLVDKQYGGRTYCTHVLLADQQTEEIRLGDKYGRCVARMRRTGFIQNEDREKGLKAA